MFYKYVVILKKINKNNLFSKYKKNSWKRKVIILKIWIMYILVHYYNMINVLKLSTNSK